MERKLSIALGVTSMRHRRIAWKNFPKGAIVGLIPYPTVVSANVNLAQQE